MTISKRASIGGIEASLLVSPASLFCRNSIGQYRQVLTKATKLASGLDWLRQSIIKLSSDIAETDDGQRGLNNRIVKLEQALNGKASAAA